MLANPWGVRRPGHHPPGGAARGVRQYGQPPDPRPGLPGYREFAQALTLVLGRVLGAAYSLPAALLAGAGPGDGAPGAPASRRASPREREDAVNKQIAQQTLTRRRLTGHGRCSGRPPRSGRAPHPERRAGHAGHRRRPVTVSFLTNWAGGTRLETLQKALPEFQRQHPHITVDFQYKDEGMRAMIMAQGRHQHPGPRGPGGRPVLPRVRQPRLPLRHRAHPQAGSRST